MCTRDAGDGGAEDSGSSSAVACDGILDAEIGRDGAGLCWQHTPEESENTGAQTSMCSILSLSPRFMNVVHERFMNAPKTS